VPDRGSSPCRAYGGDVTICIACLRTGFERAKRRGQHRFPRNLGGRGGEASIKTASYELPL
jgi:hypothetical protein